jgi:enterochelin esterase-like enzyme
MKKSASVIAFLFPLLTGCLATPGVALATLPPGCSRQGTTQMLTVDSVGEVGLYLPPCFDPHTEAVYPVLYLLPGFGGSPNDWFGTGLAAVADEAILGGQVPPFLIVTTDDTLEDTSPEAIVDHLIPSIESHYPAGSRPRLRAVAGGSLGGASAYMLAFQHPDLFASAGVFGNGLVTGQEDELRSLLADIPEDFRPRLFLNSGEDDAYMFQQAQALIPLLDEAGIAHTEVFGPGGHSGAYWLSNFPAYFRWLAEDWR